MRFTIVFFIIIGSLIAPARAALPTGGDFSSMDAIAKWVASYRAHPQPGRLPAAVRALSALGAFKEPEGAGVYVGFIAGVLGSNPDKAEELIGRMLSIAPVDQWAIVRAIAYSGHPDWQRWLRKYADRMPMRKAMIEKYLDGRLQTLDEVALEKKGPTLWDRLRDQLPGGGDRKRVIELTFDKSPELLDTLWGFYFATGSEQPVTRMIALLPWAAERDSVDKLTMGNMAKYTLASNAARDASLLAMLKRARNTEPRKIASVLNEVIDAAESVETTHLRKDALAAIEELKRKGPGSKRDWSTWGTIGQGALALGCIVAATTGHVEFGLPCMIGGAAPGAAMSVISSQ